MRLLLFDLDDTLTRTMDLDADCFVRAFEACFGFTDIDTDWRTYPDVTDAGIARDLFVARRGRPPTPDELARVQRRFVAMMDAEVEAAPARCQPIPGAAALLDALALRPEFALAVGTGAWEASARFKMARAGLHRLRGVPLATSDDDARREAIAHVAVRRARAHYAREDFADLVLIGDAVWDVQTAQRLGCGFIGIGAGVAADRLRAAGARHVLADYTDLDAFFALLARLR